jgi:hypothetical protein
VQHVMPERGIDDLALPAETRRLVEGSGDRPQLPHADETHQVHQSVGEPGVQGSLLRSFLCERDGLRGGDCPGAGHGHLHGTFQQTAPQQPGL